MLLSKNTTSEIVTYGEGANNVRNAIPWSGISDKEIGRYTVTAEYCPVQINVGMPKNPYPLSLADSGARIIRIRSNQEVPDYFTDPSEKSTDEHLRLSSVSGIFKYDDVYWGIHTRPNDSQYKSSFESSRIDQPQQRFAEKDMLLMEGNPGYEELNRRLLGLDWHHKSLRYEVIDADTMLTLWEDCPLI